MDARIVVALYGLLTASFAKLPDESIRVREFLEAIQGVVSGQWFSDPYVAHYFQTHTDVIHLSDLNDYLSSEQQAHIMDKLQLHSHTDPSEPNREPDEDGYYDHHRDVMEHPTMMIMERARAEMPEMWHLLKDINMVRSDGSLDEKAIRMTLPKEYSELLEQVAYMSGHTEHEPENPVLVPNKEVTPQKLIYALIQATDETWLANHDNMITQLYSQHLYGLTIQLNDFFNQYSNDFSSEELRWKVTSAVYDVMDMDMNEEDHEPTDGDGDDKKDNEPTDANLDDAEVYEAKNYHIMEAIQNAFPVEWFTQNSGVLRHLMGIDKGSMVKLPDLNLDEESRKLISGYLLSRYPTEYETQINAGENDGHDTQQPADQYSWVYGEMMYIEELKEAIRTMPGATQEWYMSPDNYQWIREIMAQDSGVVNLGDVRDHLRKQDVSENMFETILVRYRDTVIEELLDNPNNRAEEIFHFLEENHHHLTRYQEKQLHDAITLRP